MVHEYAYWSDRLVESLIDSNASGKSHRWQAEANLGVLNFQVSNGEPRASKAAQAKLLEKILSNRIVQTHSEDLDVEYLTGVSRVVVSVLQSGAQHGDGAVNLFMQTESSTGKRIAVCLFGSRTNVIGQDTQVPPWRMYGWTSSSNPGVDLIVNASMAVADEATTTTAWRDIKPWPRHSAARTACRNALNISTGQGSYRSDMPQPWHRGYTLGHFQSAEWLARIYYTATDVSVPGHEFDFVHVGTPIWVRTMTPAPWTPYTFDQIPHLEASQFPHWLQRLALFWYQRKGRHLRHRPSKQ